MVTASQVEISPKLKLTVGGECVDCLGKKDAAKAAGLSKVRTIR